MRTLGPGFWIKLLLLGLLDALAVYVIPFIWGQWSAIGLILAMVVFVNWAFLNGSNLARGLRWLAPGLIFFVGLTVVPVLYNAYIAFTNYSIQHFLPKEQVVQSLATYTFKPENPETLALFVYENDAGDLRFLLQAEGGEVFFAIPFAGDEPPDPPVEDLASYETTDADGDGIPEQVDGFRLLQVRDLIPIVSQLQELKVLLPGKGEAQVTTFKSADLKEQRYVYDATRDVLVDRAEGVECPADDEQGAFVCPDERGALTPGWPVPVGFDNFTKVWNNQGIRQPFLRVFWWNVLFASASVLFTLVVGMILALTLHDDRLRGKKLYRSVYILPYAIPVLISASIWRGLLNTRFGPVNRLIEPIVGLFRDSPIPWLQDPFWAKAGVLLMQTWLGFPYMFLIVTGALQAIPSELIEAARVDGASARQAFWRVTFPLLMVSIAPLLIGSFAFNFNNFIPIFFLTTGGPPLTGYAVPVGETDILITFTYNLAVASGRGGQFALAAAISFFIFFIVAAISAFSFRYTKRLEETYGGL